MERTKILVDTGVLVDFFVDNEPFSDYAKKILFLCHRGEIDGLVTAASLVQLFYVLEKELPLSDRREMLRLLLKIFSVPSVDKQKIFDALSYGESGDLIQGLQLQSAASSNVDCIVTNNIDNYYNAEIRTMTAGEFVNLYEKSFVAEKFSRSFASERKRSVGGNINASDDWQARFRASAYGL